MHWFDIIAAIVFAYSLVQGYKSGFIKQLASLSGVVACIFLSDKVALIIQPYLETTIPASLLKTATFTTAFLLIIALFFILGYMLQRILESSKKIGTLNKLLGSALSMLKWILLVSIFFNLMINVDKENLLIPKDIEKHSVTFQYIQPLATRVAPYLKKSVNF